MKRIIQILLIFFIVIPSKAQLFGGISFGTFKVPDAGRSFNGFGPTVKIEFIGEDDNQSAYLDVSLYTKKYPAGETDIVNDIGSLIGRAETTDKYVFKYVQLGFKKALGRPGFSDTKALIFFLGGGAAISFLDVKRSYDLPGYEIKDSKYSQFLYGFHFNSGLQYNLESVSFELKGSLDFVLKPIGEAGGNIMTGLRLGVLIPLSKK